MQPRGSKYPILEASGSKNHTLNGFRDQRPKVFSTWTLWVCNILAFVHCFEIFGNHFAYFWGPGKNHIQPNRSSSILPPHSN